ncbi:MAG TPA: protein kinase [Kofleriaceae bacterium]
MPARLGRYELIGHLATGGMAEIHLARLAGEAGFEKIVVVKRLLPELVASQAFVSMFLDEGKLVSRLDHPNVCEVHELGRDGAEYFLAMPFLDGVSVHELISRPREPDRIAELRISTGIVTQACAGLHHAHELKDTDGTTAGLVHRDVSPSNLFVTATGIVKVLDFGIAKVRGAAETEAGTIKGKTQYMAPEQLLGEPLDRRCDVFALGIVLFELATHQRLFKRASEYLSARAVLEEDIPRADAVDPAIPAAVADVIAKALARNKADRYDDAAALSRALEAAMASHGGIAGPSAIAQVVTSTDELTAQRTRQAKVLAAATGTRPARPATMPVGTSVTSAATRVVDPEPTQVAPRPTKSTSPMLMTLLVFVVVFAGAGLTYRYALHGDPMPDEDSVASSHPGRERPLENTDATRPIKRVAVPALPDAAVAEPTEGSDIEMPAEHARPKKPGTVSIDSTPFATIFIDEKRVDVTPLLNYSLSPGKHRVRAVLSDGRKKEVSVDVPSGKAAKPLSLTW